MGALAYLTDVSAIPEATLALLDGLDVLVLDALRVEPHPTHFSIKEAVSVAQRIGARQTFFVHMTHTVSHAAVSATLPEGIALAYDELTVDVRH
ncbi:MAG TPA: MBL fold metallo-hydrolase, partial [Rhodothermales bacterium]|nr:MBL fold metallo-hydrolase [Rhodothermales bacterium]